MRESGVIYERERERERERETSVISGMQINYFDSISELFL